MMYLHLLTMLLISINSLDSTVFKELSNDKTHQKSKHLRTHTDGYYMCMIKYELLHTYMITSLADFTTESKYANYGTHTILILMSL